MKLKAITTLICLAGMIMTTPVRAEDPIRVFVDNSEVTFEDQFPQIIDDRTYVPVRAVFEKAGASIMWDADTKTAVLEKEGYNVSITVGDSYLFKNSKPTAIDAPARIINDRLLIPIRAISEAMDFGITWNTTKRHVLVNTEGTPYRSNSKRNTGFLPIQDIGFIVEGAINDVNYFDLDNDGYNDTIGFVPAHENNKGGLWLNSMDVSKIIDSEKQVYAAGVVDFVKSDDYKEIVLLYNTEIGKCIGIYRYNGEKFFHIMSDKTSFRKNTTGDGMIYFNDLVFADGKENIISDTDGLCFLNDMVCTGINSLEGDEIKIYLSIPDVSIGKTYTRIYDDNIPLSYIVEEDYLRGHYASNREIYNDVIYSNDLSNFKILDCYIDKTDPSLFEFFIMLPDGTTAVIWPYTV